MDLLRNLFVNFFVLTSLYEAFCEDKLEDLFKWTSSVPSNCRTLDSCCGVTNVTCMDINRRVQIPPYYCRRLPKPKPPSFIPCRTVSQDCVMALWSDWSECSSTCSSGRRFRSRQILLKNSRNGIPCGSTSESEACHTDAVPCESDTLPFYYWHVEPWTSCLPTVSTRAGSPSCSRGERTRKVTCRSRHGYDVASSFCHNETDKPITDEPSTDKPSTDKPKMKRTCFEKAAEIMNSRLLGAYVPQCEEDGTYSRVQCHTDTATCWCATREGARIDGTFRLRGEVPKCEERTEISEPGMPSTSESCTLPCDCTVSPWSSWSACSVSCFDSDAGKFTQGIVRRSRTVVTPERNNGLQCPHLVETAPCREETLRECPRYTWHNSTWSQCKLRDKSALCGPGRQTRRTKCVLDEVGFHTQVDESLCTSDPVAQRPCIVECPVDCQLGEWGTWEACNVKCEQIRQRPLLVRPRNGGKKCGTLKESRVCQDSQCFRWYIGQWSTCETDHAATKCGTGSRIRSVYCVSQNERQVPDSNCSNVGKPPASETCTALCPEDCKVSSWTKWSPCSVSCGYQGGIKFRTREVINSTSDQRCLKKRELDQTRLCNRKACPEYLWQVAPWSVCLRDYNGSESCGPNTGYQERDVFCEGYNTEESPVDPAKCHPILKPEDRKPCDLPCPIHCKITSWTKWSKCSKKCGDNSYKYKTRHVIRRAMHGGKSCPLRVGDDGYDIRQKKCTNVSSCPTFSWTTTRWSGCRPAVGECGFGKQTRNVSCQRGEGPIVAYDKCYSEGLGSPPPSQQSCFTSCSGDCPLTNWGSWSACSQSCGTIPGTKARWRTFVSSSESKSVQCSSVRENELVQMEACGQKQCPKYEWVAGPWTDCIPKHYSKITDFHMCGEGIQRRSVLCRRDDGQFVSDDYCGYKEHRRPCVVPCPVDCHVSEWSEGECSRKCGQGVKTLTRSVVQPAAHGGRQCPHLKKTEMCYERPCRKLHWIDHSWSSCTPSFGLPCSAGYRRRDVKCSSGNDEDCAEREPKPLSREQCDKPCSGDCVLTEWTEYSGCSCPKGSHHGNMTRSRLVVKEPKPNKFQCGALKEVKSCRCHTYKLDVGDFSHCEIKQEKECGKGIERRPVACLRDDGHPVSMTFCDDPVPHGNERQCDVPCAVDCKLSQYSSWSGCSEKCGLNGIETRAQNVIQTPAHGGRQCPPEHELKQEQSCNGDLCHTYAIERSDWSECHVGKRGCGLGSRTRTVTCRRSDGHEVDIIYCKLNGEPMDTATTLELLKDIDETALDMQTTATCGRPCPGDCVVTEWSSWGPCLRNCSVAHPVASRIRSRAVVEYPQPQRQQCPTNMVEEESCPADSLEACPRFFWKTTKWDKAGRRDVYCLLAGGVRVTGGCKEVSKPSADKTCSPGCGEHSTCVAGKCKCQAGFEGNGQRCFPMEGCVADEHCAINGTYCDTETWACKCTNGVLVNGIYCNENPHGAGETLSGFMFDTNNVYTWLILGGIALVVFLIFLVVIVLVCRRKRSGDVEIDVQQHPNNMPPPKKINNDLSTNLGPAGKYTKNRFSGSHLPSHYDKNLKLFGRLMKVKDVEDGADAGNLYVSGSPESDLSDDVFLDDPSPIMVQLPPLSADYLEEAMMQNGQKAAEENHYTAAPQRALKPILKKTSAYDGGVSRGDTVSDSDSSGEEEDERRSMLADGKCPRSPTNREAEETPGFCEDLSHRIVAQGNEYTAFNV